MAEFTIYIPNDKVTDLVNAFATQYKYREQVEDPANPGEMIDNPINKVNFAKNIVRSFIKEVYIAGKLASIEATRLALIEATRLALIEEGQTETELIDVT